MSQGESTHTRRVFVGNTEVLERARVRGNGLRCDQRKGNKNEVGRGSHLVLHSRFCLCSLNIQLRSFLLACCVCVYGC